MGADIGDRSTVWVKKSELIFMTFSCKQSAEPLSSSDTQNYTSTYSCLVLIYSLVLRFIFIFLIHILHILPIS